MKRIYGADVRGPFRIQRVSTLPAWTADDEGRLVYAEDTDKFYYGDSTGWVEAGGGGAAGGGDVELPITQFDPDDNMPGVHTSSMWEMVSTVGLSPLEDGAVWACFRFKDNWSTASDIKFRLEYGVTSQHIGSISLNAKIWVVPDNSIPDEDNPDYGPVEDEINPTDLNIYDQYGLSNIEVPAANLTTSNCSIIIKLWRDVDGCASNHSGWLEIVRLVAYQL